MIDKAIRRLWPLAVGGLFAAFLLFATPLHPAIGETIQLERNQHGTYTISVQINGTLVLPFVLDTGASSVVIPEDVVRTLTRTGTVTESDFIGVGTAVLADGSKHASDSYVLHEVRVGDHIVRNVVANVVSVNGAALLGQSFLSKLPAWSIDKTRLEFESGHTSTRCRGGTRRVWCGGLQSDCQCRSCHVLRFGGNRKR